MLKQVRAGLLSSTVLSSCPHNAVLAEREENKKTNIGKRAIAVTLPVPYFPQGGAGRGG